MNQFRYMNFDKLKGRLSKHWIESLRYLNFLLNEDKPQIITHNDPDGLISGLLLRMCFQSKNLDPLIIPVSYNNLNLPEFLHLVEMGEYLAITDLPPFNRKACEVYVDHHSSIDPDKINAKQVFFDPQASSAAKIIVNEFKVESGRLRYLATLTELTDTGVLPKYEIPVSLETPENEVEDAWLLEDIVYSSRNPKHLVRVLELLEKYKDVRKLIPEFEAAIRQKREHRKLSLAKVDSISIEDSDMVILIIPTRKYQAVTLLDAIRKKDVKVVITLVRSISKQYKIYARHGFSIDEEEALRLRLDKLTEKLGGGGHVSAAGARTKNKKSVLKQLEQWGLKKGLRPSVHYIK